MSNSSERLAKIDSDIANLQAQISADPPPAYADLAQLQIQLNTLRGRAVQLRRGGHKSGKTVGDVIDYGL